ncbi:hypothetical protein [Roseinatronobacter bogoriensis]|uniref:Phosphoadenosine phosphosulfate reductase n=1 Tax=Roseinatronobacter bogoriensis subsp. barguzinensis TaxID=441209 RepID=A0A2K8KEU3_9RHOB|nr:hypothetical protein [Rhodobaca]ATX66265.1 phosphoadenosine phosphosulfate reductase [Rhodobaca barguzinensis]MBB4207387.1 hypothetical protein [Rhodobaca bogoriensis DSM 18756]TDW40306.1 hypothetical protein LY39_01340 [Rhodobaca barguzinensis]TDY70542.1 hypothetical protein EV660_102217 [Rhodobaca bogoriensis DSM 18756]
MKEFFEEIDLTTARTQAEWLARLDEIGDEVGAFTPLGSNHAAFFLDGNDTLIVSFESVDTIRRNSTSQRPRAVEIALQHGWSCLVILARVDHFYRDCDVLDFFDAQIDASFFDSFRRVLFFGAGAHGYAACTFSLAAPGATVLAISPLATLDPEIAPWETRFRRQRLLDFRSRFGFAPAMLDGARNAFIVYDPAEALDAMHATLFRRPSVNMLKTPALGDETAAALDRMGLVNTLIEAAIRGRLSSQRFADLMRSRRDDEVYLMGLVRRAARGNHPLLTRIAAQHALALIARNTGTDPVEIVDEELLEEPS